MDKIILCKDDNGNVLKATNFEPVERQAIADQLSAAEAQLKEAQSTVDTLRSAIANYDRLINPEPDTSTPPPLTGVDDGEGRVTFVRSQDQPVQI